MAVPIPTQRPAKRRLPARYRRLLEEVKRMEAVPGIFFTDGVSGRVPIIARTGIEVWEVIGLFKALEGDTEELYASLDWLSTAQVDAALEYYRAYPEEIDAAIAKNDWYLPEAGNVTYPIQL